MKERHLPSIVVRIFYIAGAIGFIVVGILIKTDEPLVGWISVIIAAFTIPLLIYQLINYKTKIPNLGEAPTTKIEALCVLIMGIGFLIASIFSLNEGPNRTTSIIFVIFTSLIVIGLAFAVIKIRKRELYYGYVNESGSIFVGKTTNAKGKLIDEWVSATDLDLAAKVLKEVTGQEVGNHPRNTNHQYFGARSILITNEYLASSNSTEQLKLVRKELASGYIAFIVETFIITNNDNPSGKGVEIEIEIVVMPGKDQFTILWAGAIDELVIKQLTIWDSKYGIDILQACPYITLKLLSLPSDLESFAEEIHVMCPDYFDEGDPKLEKDFEHNRELVLWWD